MDQFAILGIYELCATDRTVATDAGANLVCLFEAGTKSPELTAFCSMRPRAFTSELPRQRPVLEKSSNCVGETVPDRAAIFAIRATIAGISKSNIMRYSRNDIIGLRIIDRDPTIAVAKLAQIVGI